MLRFEVRTIFRRPKRRWSTSSVVMSLMIFPAMVVALEWSDSHALGMNNVPNSSDNKTALHESADRIGVKGARVIEQRSQDTARIP